MTEQVGVAKVRTSAQGTLEVYLQLAPGESCILDTGDQPVGGATYPYLNLATAPQPFTGTWDVAFVSGGPTLPAKIKTSNLASWTTMAGEDGKKFSGTATYSTTFAMPAGTADGYVLDLGRVAQSARVQVNGQAVTTLIGPVYQVFLPKSQLRPTNTLTVTVSNLMANRIADMDRNKQEWRIFYNTNMNAKLKENRGADGLFSAEKWEPLESGLLGPVTLTPAATGAPVQ
jgi:hypothetical protein